MPDAMIEQMRDIAEYRRFVKMLRSGGIGSLIMGAIAVLGNVGDIPTAPLALLPTGLGILLLADGVLMLTMPSPAVLALDASSFILIALWNGFWALMAFLANRPELAMRPAMWTVIPVVGGIYLFMQYPRFAALAQRKPDTEVMKSLDETAKDILKASLKDDARAIELKTTSFLSDEMAWRGRLGEGVLTLVAIKKHEMLFAGRDELTMEDRGKVLLGKTRKLKLCVAGKDMKGTMPPESFERLQAWLAAPAPEGPVINSGTN